MGNVLFPILASFSLFFNPFIAYLSPASIEIKDRQLSTREISLDNRQPDKFTNEVFKENILLNLAYMRGSIVQNSSIDWNDVQKPFSYTFELFPNQTFAFHEDALPEYRDQISKTTRAHFNYQEGFKTDGYLFGDGVCHFASLLNWVAQDANLKVYAPTNHDFAMIPDISAKYGISIYNQRGLEISSRLQNLYITNNKEKPIKFEFDYHNHVLKITVSEKS